MYQRYNISFDQIINQIRKDERDYILDILDRIAQAHTKYGNDLEAAVLRGAIDQINGTIASGMAMPNNPDGTPDTTKLY